MRVMVIVKASPDSEAGKMPSPELIAEMGKFNEALIAAGILLDGGRAEADQQRGPRRVLGLEPHGDQGPVRQCR